MDLRVTIVQTVLHWEKIADNLKHFDSLLHGVSETDLIVLPEMFTTGFSMNTKDFAEDMNGSAVQWMKQKAASKNSVITGSVMIREGEKTYNRLLWVSPDGLVQHYDKRHLFRMGNEHEHYAAGSSKIFPEVKGWKICPLICYDLRFPVWARNQMPHYDVLVYVANWPEARRHPWKTLLTARAIENQSYVIGVNRIGTDAREIAHAGDSCVCDPTGHWISNTVPYKESVETVLLSRKELDQFREKFPVLLDADSFSMD